MKTLEGNVDRLGPSPLLGWARSVSDPDKRLKVRISLEGRSLGVATADQYRPDLEAAGLGDGRYAFSFDLAGKLDLSSAQRLDVLCDDGEEAIWSGSTAELLAHASALRELRRRPLWAVHRLEWSDSGLAIGGYLVPSADDPAPDPVWTLDGEPFELTEYPVASPPAPARLWFVPDHQRLGFTCRSGLNPARDSGGTGPVIECIDRRTGKPLNDEGAFYIPADFRQQLRHVPGPSRMLRVQGHERPDIHLLWGCTARHKFERVLNRTFGRGIASFGSILDWGSGCGRLARHLAAVPGPRLTGVDIDPDNVAWCRDHLVGAKFETVPLHPPTGLARGSFDLILGVSVMTHLREDDQIAWLQELERIAAPGAIVLLTINAETAIWWSDPPAEVLNEWWGRGFSDLARDPALDGFIADGDYYRATFHRADYVRRVWSENFEVVDIAPAFAHIQDLVVMRKR